MTRYLDVESIVDGLKELSDEDFQRRSWVEGSSDEVSSFDELICQIFDDTGLDDVLDGSEPHPKLASEARDKLVELGHAVALAPTDLPPDEFVRRPEMIRIREIAAEALTILDAGNSLPLE